MSKYYVRYTDEKKVKTALEMFSKKRNVELEKEVKKRFVGLLVRRLKGTKTYKLTNEDKEIVGEMKTFFGDIDFETGFVLGLKKLNYCLERYKKGEIKYKTISKEYERLFADTNKLIDGMEEFVDHKGWKKSTEKDGTKIYTRLVEGNSFKLVKGKTTVNTKWDYVRVARYIYDLVISNTEPEDFEEYKKIDIDCQYAVNLHDFDENNCMTHLRYGSGNILVYDREFIFTRKFVVKEDKKTAYVLGCSPEYYQEEMKDWFPQDKSKCVRGISRMYCYQTKVMKDGSLRLSYAAHINPNGWVPAILYNLKVTNKGHGVTRYRKLIEVKSKEDEEESEEEEEGEEEDEGDIEANLV